jgi:hypothetical protein
MYWEGIKLHKVVETLISNTDRGSALERKKREA